MSINQINSKAGFDQLLEESRIAVVYYIGEQCPNCFAMAEIREALMQGETEAIAFAEIDATMNRKLAMSNRVLGIPTTQFYKRGKLIDSVHGLTDLVTLKEMLETTKAATLVR